MLCRLSYAGTLADAATAGAQDILASVNGLVKASRAREQVGFLAAAPTHAAIPAWDPLPRALSALPLLSEQPLSLVLGLLQGTPTLADQLLELLSLLQQLLAALLRQLLGNLPHLHQGILGLPDLLLQLGPRLALHAQHPPFPGVGCTGERGAHPRKALPVAYLRCVSLARRSR